MKAFEVEVGDEQNSDLYFRPLLRRIRGRFDMQRIAEPQAKVKAAEWPEPIPGQRLGIDASGAAYVAEPLHDKKFEALREKLAKQGYSFEPPIQEVEGADICSWVFWIKKAVESGNAKLTIGALPDKVEGQPRLNFILSEQPTREDKLAAAIEAQTRMFERLLARLEP